MIPIEENRIILVDGHFVRESISRTDLGPQAQLLADYMNRNTREPYTKPVPLRFLDLYSLAPHGEEETRLTTRVACSSSLSAIITSFPLNFLNMTGYYVRLNRESPDELIQEAIQHECNREWVTERLKKLAPERSILIPQRGETVSSKKMKCVLALPAFTYLIVLICQTETTLGFQYANIFSVNYTGSRANAHPYVFSMPNIHSDGHLCMGSDFGDLIFAKTTLSSIQDTVTEYLRTSMFNFDLFKSDKSLKNMIMDGELMRTITNPLNPFHIPEEERTGYSTSFRGIDVNNNLLAKSFMDLWRDNLSWRK